MSGLLEELAYTKGLAEGLLEGAESEAVVRVVKRLLSLSELMAARITEIEAQQKKLNEYVETVDGDLDRLERTAYGISEADGRESRCPSCKEKLVYDADILNRGGEVECPACHHNVLLEAAE
ncbi:MAG: hypothetical protein PHT33_06555 [bacterium]|nr:hypothetical protein [bacterium]